MSALRQFGRASAVMALLYAGSAGLSLAVGVMLARLLGAAQYGIYALAMTTATLAGLVTEFGLPTLAMRETGRARAGGGGGDWRELRGLLHWADRAILALSAVLLAGFYLGYGLVGRAQGSAYLATLLWGVALVPVVGIGKLRALVLLALDRVVASQLPVLIARPALFIILCLGLTRITSLTAPLAMAAQVAGAGVAMLALLALFARARPAALAAAVPAFAVRRWLATCLPMGLNEGLRLLQGQLALLLVGALADAAAAGVYRVADATMQVALTGSAVVATAATPMFARLHRAGDMASITRVALLAAWAMLGAVFALGLPLAVLGARLFPLVFGGQFAASWPVFVVLWAGMLATSACGLALAIANMVGHHRLASQSFAIIVALNAVLGGVLIGGLAPGGALGAAIASAIAMVAGSAWCAVRLYRLTGIDCTLANPAAAGILLAGLRLAMARLATSRGRHA